MARAPLTVFISYRRGDAPGFAGRLADTLRSGLDDDDMVLRDVDELIEPGTDFKTAIADAIAGSDVVLAVIGRGWASAPGAGGTPRLHEAEDIVRLELLGALERDIPVIPVLVDGASMPGADQLPSTLGPLATRNAIEISDSRWKADCEQLSQALARHAGRSAEPALTLPAPATALIGRDGEVAAVSAQLGDGVRLITLTGPGGIGKTSIALAVARAEAESFRKVVFCDATTVDHPGRAMAAIAAAAGIEEPGEERLIDHIARSLGAVPTLLVLDNFEHLVAAGPELGQLLSLAPGLQTLATSRAPIRISGEHEHQIGPLADDDAVELFIERARAVRPEVMETSEAAAAVSQICMRLDGLPLAIELAAARTRLLPPEAILNHLGSRLDLLTHGPQDLPERQQTVRATIDWSYRLLDEPDRALLARMSVFAGGATLDAVQAVCVPEGDAIEVLDRLQTLAENSLIQAREDAAGNQRFQMLELIREFAAAKVAEEDEDDLLRDRHVEFFAEFAERYGPPLRSAEVATAFPRFDSDYANLIDALQRACDAAKEELELQLLGWLSDYWYFRGRYAEGWPWMEHGLRLGDPPAALRARVTRGAGDLRIRMGDIDGARQLFESALETYRELGDLAGQARSLSGLEGCYARTEEFELAERFGNEALEIVREIGDRPRLAFSACNAGYTAMQRGQLDRARAFFEEASEVANALPHPEAIASIEQNRGLLAVLEGDVEAALDPTIRGLQGSLELREHLGILCSLVGVAAIHARHDRPADAARMIGLVEAELEVRDYVLDPVEADVIERTLVALGDVLPDDELHRALQQGRKADLMEAAQEAIDTVRHPAEDTQ